MTTNPREREREICKGQFDGQAAAGILILVLLIYADYITMKWKFFMIFVLKSNNSFSASLNMIVL